MLLLLDLDDTLIDDRSAMRGAFEAFLAFHGPVLQEVEDPLKLWREVSQRHWIRFERGEVTFQEQRRARVRDFLGQPFTDAEADAAFEPYRQAYEAAWSLFPEVPEFLSRAASWTKVLITNGEREQQRLKVRRVGLDPHIADIITPMDCGAWKPDPRIFQEALERHGASRTEAIMIGDDERRDIEPAARLGLRTFRVDASDPERTLLKALEGLSL